MARRPVLSIVTVFWNGLEDVDGFFGSIAEAKRRLPFPVETIAIDNASTDGTPEAIESRHDWVRLVRNGENLGFAPACNQGIDIARGDYVLLLNPDCEAGAEALAGMVRFLRRHPQAGAVGCALLHADGLPQHSWHHEPSWWSYWGTHSMFSPAVVRLGKLIYPLGSRDSRPFRVDWLMGACLMVPRRVIEEIGGLDPDYFMYSEDADWCRRIWEAGFEVVHLPRLSVIHHQGTSARRRPEFTFRRLYRSLLMYARKHLTGFAGTALRGAVLADLALRIPIYTLHGNRDRLESLRQVFSMYWNNNPEDVD